MARGLNFPVGSRTGTNVGLNPSPTEGTTSGGLNPLALLGLLWDEAKEHPEAAKLITGLAGTYLATQLNKPSVSDKEATAALNRAANAQASDVEANVRRKNELEKLIKTLKPLSGEQKNKLIQRSPGKVTDFSDVRGTGDIDLMMQLVGLGSQSGLVGQAGAMANQNDLFGQQQTENTVNNLVELLLGLGGGGTPATPAGGFPLGNRYGVSY